MRLSLLKADTNIFCVRCSIKPNTSYYFPFWNIPLKIKNKHFKSLFPFRGGIIAINGKNAIEAKRGVNKRVFYKLINSFISFEILLNSFRLIIIAIDEKNITKYKNTLPVKGRVKYARDKKLPIIKAVNRNNLSLIMEYWNFNISNAKLDLFITQGFFSSFKSFSFYVIFYKRLYPIWDRFFMRTPSSNRIIRHFTNISKIFFSEFSFFKQFIKFFFIHLQAFINQIDKIIISNFIYMTNIVLTYIVYMLYNNDYILSI